jgi:hypothetical protein
MKGNKIEVYDNKNGVTFNNYPPDIIFFYYYTKNNFRITRYSNYMTQGIRINIRKK